jgi:hypothetical protein
MARHSEIYTMMQVCMQEDQQFNPAEPLITKKPAWNSQLRTVG